MLLKRHHKLLILKVKLKLKLRLIYLKKSLVSKISTNSSNLMTSIQNSHMNTLFKTLGRTYNTFKMLIGNMLWEVLVILRIDRLVTPLIKNIFLILMITVKIFMEIC